MTPMRLLSATLVSTSLMAADPTFTSPTTQAANPPTWTWTTTTAGTPTFRWAVDDATFGSATTSTGTSTSFTPSAALTQMRQSPIAAGSDAFRIILNNGSMATFGSTGTAVGTRKSTAIALTNAWFNGWELFADGTVAPLESYNDSISSVRGAVQIAHPDGFNAGLIVLHQDGTVTRHDSIDDSFAGNSIPANWTNLVAISGGYLMAAALKSDGSLVDWNSSGTTPTGTDFVQVDTGYQFSAAVRSNGTMVTWGDSRWKPTVPSGLTNVVSVAAGYGIAAAIKSDGTVTLFGTGDTPELITGAPTLSDIAYISFGKNLGEYAVAIKKSGAVLTWGTYQSGGTVASVSYKAKISHRHTLYLQEQSGGSFGATVKQTITIDPDAVIPTVTASATNSDGQPTWSWTTGGGAGSFRYALAEADLTTATSTTATSYTPTAKLPDGFHTLWLQEYTSIGTWADAVSKSVTIDAPFVQPTLTGPTDTTDPTPTWSWVSGGGGTGLYRWKLDDSSFTSGSTTTEDLSYTPATGLTDGTHTFYLQAQQAGGTWGATQSASITLDAALAAPVATCATTQNVTRPVWTWGSGGGGNGTYRYKIGSSDLTTGATETTTAQVTASATSSHGGSQTLYVQERDAAGTWSSTTSITVTADLVAPTVTSFVMDQTEYTKYEAFTATLTFSEAITGLTLADLVAVNATDLALTGSGTTYTITGNAGDDPGLTGVSVPMGAGEDAGGTDSPLTTATGQINPTEDDTILPFEGTDITAKSVGGCGGGAALILVLGGLALRARRSTRFVR